MNTLRNELKSKYSQIPNELVTDLTLCAGSLRVLLYLFTKPDDWNVYNLDICKQLNISERTLTKYWKILLSSKWLRREQKRNEKGILTGGYFYHIGNFTISEKSSESDKRCDYNNNKPIHKEETNTNSDFPDEKVEQKKVSKKKRFENFIKVISDGTKYKTKCAITQDGFKLYQTIEDKKLLVKDYLKHLDEKKEFAKRITAFMKDYEAYKGISNTPKPQKEFLI